MPLRVLDADGSGFASDTASTRSTAPAISGVRVVNASFGASDPSNAEFERDRRPPARRCTWSSAGNDSVDVDDATPDLPVRTTTLDNVLCVGASDPKRQGGHLLELRRQPRSTSSLPA